MAIFMPLPVVSLWALSDLGQFGGIADCGKGIAFAALDALEHLIFLD